MSGCINTFIFVFYIGSLFYSYFKTFSTLEMRIKNSKFAPL